MLDNDIFYISNYYYYASDCKFVPSIYLKIRLDRKLNFGANI